MKYHCHIYEVPMKAEIDIESNTEIEARVKALELAKENKLIFGINHEGKFQCLSFESRAKKQTHILIEKAFIYPPGLKQVLNPSGYVYDFEKGAWVKKQSKKEISQKNTQTPQWRYFVQQPRVSAVDI